MFGLAPVATAPPAQADLFDFDGLGDLLGSAVADPASSVDPAGFDALLQQWVYQPVDTLVADWISSPLGQQIDSLVDSAGWPGSAGDENAWSWLLANPGGGAESAGAAAATPVLQDAGSGAAPALADAIPAADPSTANSVPLQINAVTEPVTDISVDGGSSIPVVVDTGSNGLTIPWSDIGPQNLLTLPSSFGVGAFSGGMNFLYGVYNLPVSFANGIGTTGTVPVDAVLFAWPTSLQTLFTGWSIPSFLGPANADGILGIGTDAVGPNAPGTPTVIQELPAGLNQGVLIDEPKGQLVFGPAPEGGVSVNGVANANLEVSVDGSAPQPVSGAVIDSGGVFGTIPQSLVPGTQVGQAVPDGVPISVYNSDGQLLYSYTTSGQGIGSPTVISDGTPMNTGYYPFAQAPVYIGTGTTIFYP